MNFCDFYKGRRVLITGHTGFKGGWLTLWLKHLGAELCGISLPPETDPSLFEIAAVADGIESHFLNITDAEEVTRIVQGFEPEMMFHLAAQPFVRRSYAQPVETFASNVMGTIHLLEAARQTDRLRHIIVITSDKVYENLNTGHAFRVGDRLGGTDPYSASKSCVENVVHSWRESFFRMEGRVNIASARAGNVFGGGDWGKDRLVSDIARAVATGQEVILRNPGYTRPWQHVLDVVAGYLQLGQLMGLDDGSGGFDTAWNFGPFGSEAVAVGPFARQIVERWGAGVIVERPSPNAPKESVLLQLDSGESVDKLGWRPMLPLAEAIDWTVAWYAMAMRSYAQARTLSAQQLDAYAERMLETEMGS